MSAQWTSRSPGRGDLGAFASFSAVLKSDQTFLADTDAGVDRLHRSLDLAIGGQTLEAASARMARTLTRAAKIATSLKAVEAAIEEYKETVEEIKRKAAAAEQQRAEAAFELSKTYIDSPTSPPSDDELDRRRRAYAKAQRELDEAELILSQMAELRQAADDRLIAVIGDRAYELVDIDLITKYPTDRQDLHHTEKYDYHYTHRVASSDEFSAEEAMKIFQENPGDIFPFKIKDTDSFVDGDTIRLLDTTGRPVDDDGWVRVSTTPTSVTFTVVSNDYFDGQGSTITFQTVERDGQIYLEQIADADDVNVFAEIGVTFGGAQDTWDTQADNFRDVLEEHRK